MKRLSFALTLLFFSVAALAQGAFIPPQTALKNINGLLMPIANATITVCAANTGGIPCSPALVNTVFKDSGLTESLPNPFTADQNGNYQFAAAPANYTVTVSAAGFAGYSYQVTLGGSGGGSGSGTVGTGSIGQAAYYAANGTVVGGQPDLVFSGLTSTFPNGPVDIGAAQSTCGSATACIAMPTSTGAVTPASGQNTLRFTAAGPECSVNGGAEGLCGGGGGGNPTLDDCTPDQTGNSFFSVASLLAVYSADWQFVFNTTTGIYCKIYIPAAATGATFVLDVWSADSTAGHTALFDTCDHVVNAGSMQVSSTTCAASQTFTTTSTAYNRVTLTFNVQSTLSSGSILFVYIETSPTGTAPASNMFVYPHFVL